MDRARYLDPLKRKTKEPIYEYFKTKVKEAYKAASDSPGERQLNLRKNSPTFPKGRGTPNLSKRSGSLGTYAGYGNKTSSATYGYKAKDPSPQKNSKFAKSYNNPVLIAQAEREWTINTAKRITKGSKSELQKTIKPSVSMAGGGGNYPAAGQKKSSGSVNQFAIGEQNRQAKAQAASDKTKTGASAAPATKKSWFQRRQAERYAIGSSGKSL